MKSILQLGGMRTSRYCMTNPMKTRRRFELRVRLRQRACHHIGHSHFRAIFLLGAANRSARPSARRTLSRPTLNSRSWTTSPRPASKTASARSGSSSLPSSRTRGLISRRLASSVSKAMLRTRTGPGRHRDWPPVRHSVAVVHQVGGSRGQPRR